jgi:hypothetical protein
MTETSGTNDETPMDDDQQVEALRQELAGSDPAVVIANHCYGLFELAAVYLSDAPPRLAEAQMAIDALAGLTDAVGSRLGDGAEPINEALAQLRLAWVQLNAVTEADEPPTD